ncbi:MAG: hypothetical protein A2821_02755 [Candidatus Magasanikbacteria bacterium RIFCSPHIGHO2_01_FULL_41_23]|uniref:Uncharacterized protein n=1 Tax=Candidatus Magasanikbacteria bacterium RIFCSPLOWO2_01_FULL_40_15 TaxID=1798686 RepID=A0A1F6N1L5_9BACT|nr:MAG: hypothetical protein A2821_02755 [Candidatus Magasanikbacteria bacterium RIFCSPHIGHO2_01_FULL_41_23]OGH67260.1 MAG: hypothetical protein A3C66_00775 [Candidatus Magasanikbacteria bacterium RIFCSPHIGHO2_02_FULL_41_35]OGH74805.1 MAG: hypothetical protein A3F22_04825 [Candidatus Magasanikbacteria bacterium RIFCSPHIGHO2_12_FULL_41_16]OGH77827.1 MAG: hypothetical protein A2983_00325 [Candidatus Magasanikbacteria bacterium RIFCSPLOWO2_01_FULL_40_15]
MDTPVQPSINNNEDNDPAHYERLLALYNALEEELLNLQAQGKLLRHQAHIILDKQKMLQVLQDISHHR